MSVSQADIDFALEIFSEIGPMTTRKMMGGLCIYCEGQIFAILSSQGRLYLKAKDEFARKLQSAGAEIFAMDDGRSMGYWTLPDAALDDPELACDWARQALAHV